MSITFGSHCSTFELDYDKESDNFPHIMDVVKESGLKGIDSQISLLGRFLKDPLWLKDEYDKRGLAPVSLTVPFTWGDFHESDEEKERADYFIGFAKKLSDNTILNIVPRSGPNRDDVVQRRKQILSCANAVAKRAKDRGVDCSFHPCSPLTSYIRTSEDYEVMFDLIDSSCLGWTPDVGHIFYGGMDVLNVIKDHASMVRHVHFKDASKGPVWSTLGEGDIPFEKIIVFLHQYGYKHWIMMEEETADSSANPERAVRRIGRYVEEHFIPLVED